MESGAETIHYPLSALLLWGGGAILAAGLAVAVLTAYKARRERLRQFQDDDAPRDWSEPAIDASAHLDSPFHRWDPRVKIVSLLFFIFCVASLARISTGAAAIALGLAAAGAARIPWSRSLRRLGAMAGFLLMLIIVTPLTAPIHPGDPVVVFEHLEFLPINLRGLLPAGLVCVKAVAIALLMEPLVGTSPLASTMEALAQIGAPRKVGEMILLAHRYVFVFRHEAQRMATSMEVRGFRKRTDMETLRATGNFIGMLLVRSFDRTQRVYEAMLSRGYGETTRSHVAFTARKMDWVKGAFWIAAGVALLVADHFRGA
jgi:cobalt/nickel transport system permease protein